MIRKRLSTAFACFFVAGCVATANPLEAPSPGEVPALQAALEADPEDVDVALRLAAAYREAGRSREALVMVDALLEDIPEDAGLLVMSGLLSEDVGAFATARARYDQFLAGGPRGALREEVERRIELVRQEVLREEVRSSLARESELAQSVPDPGAVGVFPFAYEGDDPAWRPLGPALAELLITDLGITGRLTVLERVKVQALVDELELTLGGLVEEASAVRSGRLLGSGHIVQGSYRIEPEDRIGVDAAVVEVGAPGSVTVDPVRAEDAVGRLFELEKRLALDLHAELGIDLTAAERARINERQTESVQALLAFGRGLAAQDSGDFEQAEAHFGEATRLDPGFGLAQAKRTQSIRSAAARQASAARAMQSQAARLARQRRMVQRLQASPASVRQRVLASLGQKQRAVIAELLGQDRVGTAILLELVFRAPGGRAP